MVVFVTGTSAKIWRELDEKPNFTKENKMIAKLLMDVFLVSIFGLAIALYFLCYAATTEHTTVDKIGVGFLTIMTVFTGVMVSMFTVHDD